jgi:inorganic pyrophosphatase
MKLGKHWVEHVAYSEKPDAWIYAVNEIPTGSCCKYRLDKVTGQLSLARALPHAVTFPTNYGFIPHTRSAADDEETDVMILSAEPILPLTIVRIRIIGGFIETTADKRKPEERLIGVALDDANVAAIRELDELGLELRERIERFVREYKQNEEVKVTFDGWLGRDAALAKLRKDLRLAEKRAPK